MSEDMAYCVFASGDYKSDVYAYADVAGGYTLYVSCKPIPLHFNTLDELEGALRTLGTNGYHVPDRAFEAIQNDREQPDA